MELISADIIAFGKIKNEHIDFKKKLNSYCLKNASGKTTFLEFIKAMLYGMNRVSQNSFTREHYIPFDSEKAEGSLLIKVKEDIYKIDRIFYLKQSLDYINVFKNGLITNIKGNVGELLLNMDLETFCKTIFIEPSNLEISPTKNITQKIMGDFNLSDSSIDDAIIKLNKRLKELSSYKTNFNKGLIKDTLDLLNQKKSIKNQILNSTLVLNQKKENLKEIESKILTYNENLKMLESRDKDISLLNNEIKKLDEYPLDESFYEIKKFNEIKALNEKIEELNFKLNHLNKDEIKESDLNVIKKLNQKRRFNGLGFSITFLVIFIFSILCSLNKNFIFLSFMIILFIFGIVLF